MPPSDRTVSVSFRANIADYVAKTRQMARETAKFGGDLAKAAKADKLDELSRGATVAGAALVGAFGLAVKSAADFDAAMSKVSAATHAGASDMSALREAALQAGADTAFSATEAAQAEEELAKAGVSVKDIINGGLRGALDLAAAGELSVGEAAETAATAMTQFNLAGSQIPHVADLLAAGAGKAQGDVHDMALALKQSGLVASQFGLSIEETTGTLAAFASAGLIGSDAGTSFKQMLLQLANPSQQASAMMQQLGIHAYNDQGAFVGLSGLAGQLHSKLSGLTDAQRQHALAVIFGSDAIRAATVLYNDGAKGITAWEKKVNDAGYAADTAAKKMDNLSGDLEKLRGSLETDLIKAGSGANDVLRAFADTANTSVDAVGNLPPVVAGTGTVLAGLVGTVLLGAGAFGSIAPKVATARKELEALGPAGVRASGAVGFLGNLGVAGAATAVGLGVVVTAANAVDSAVTKAEPSVGDLARSLQHLGDTGRLTGAALRVVGPGAQQLAEDLRLTGDAASGLEKADRTVSKFKQSLASLVGLHLSGDPFVEATRHAKELNSALASMVQSGYADQAQRALTDLARKSGVSFSDLLKQFPQLRSALQGMAAQADRTGGPMDDLTKSMDGNQLAAQAAADAVSNYGDQLHALNDDSLSAKEAADQFQKTLLGLKTAVDQNGRSFQGNSKGALDNRDALYQAVRQALALYDAEAKLHPGTDAATAALRRSRAALIDTLTPYFSSRQAAQRYVDTVLKIPAKKATHISAPGAKGAKSDVDALRNSISKLHNKNVVITYTESLKGRGPGESNGKPRGGLPGLIGGDRWGGIRHFDAGGIYQGTPGGLYRFAEKGTRQEALIPQNGSAARSRSILDVAAGWYGGRVAWPGTGAPAGHAGPSVLEAHIDMGDGVVRIVRTEIREANRALRARVTPGAVRR